LLSATEPLSSGEYRLGHNVLVDYFAQDQYKELNPDARILEDLGEASPRSTETELRNLLGCFLFSGDDVFKRIGVLSGGERNRYALLRMLLHPANFLLLDEPTNHLDMRAKDVLLEALSKYTGTVVFVSHDRYFIDKLSTRVFEIGEGRVEIYPGNYEDYVWRKQGGAAALQESVRQPEVVQPAQPVNGNAINTEVTTPEEPKTEKSKRLNPIKRKQMEDRFHEIEEEIVRVEAAIGDCETSLLTFVSAEETQRLTQEVNARREELQALMTEWEELGQVLQA
jgi:ATP-binding cassette, subfamily F, member 3